MMSDLILKDQQNSEQITNTMDASKSSYHGKIGYYSHSMIFYNTEIEKNDFKYLRSLKLKIVNPNGLGLGNNMHSYLLSVRNCDLVFFRGNTIGVVFEVLVGKALGKPIISLETREEITQEELREFISIFNNNPYRDSDIFWLTPSKSSQRIPSQEIFNDSKSFKKFLKLIGDAL